MASILSGYCSLAQVSLLTIETASISLTASSFCYIRCGLSCLQTFFTIYVFIKTVTLSVQELADIAFEI
jgi:hypothetical protein